MMGSIDRTARSLDKAPTLVVGGRDVVRHENRIRFGDTKKRHVVEGTSFAHWMWRLRRGGRP
jgi:hypothetical protein